MRSLLTRVCGIILFLVLVVKPASAQLDQLFRVSFVDVGQGDAIWIQTPVQMLSDGTQRSINIIIDGGPDRRNKNQLLVYLDALGLSPGSLIDYVICTHPHTDHYKGLIDVLGMYEVATIIEPGFPKGGQCDDFLIAAGIEIVNGASAQFVNLRQQTITLDFGPDVSGQIIYSDPGNVSGLGSSNTRENNASIVLRVSFGNFTFLFMGDGEGKRRTDSGNVLKFVEKILIDEHGEAAGGPLDADVIKVGHHGSKTSSTERFIQAVSPEIAVIQSGRRSFGGTFIPDQSTIDRYQNLFPNVAILRTDHLDAAEGVNSKTDTDGDHIWMGTDGILLQAFQLRGQGNTVQWELVAELVKN